LNAGITLRVSDSGGLFAEAILIITVTPQCQITCPQGLAGPQGPHGAAGAPGPPGPDLPSGAVISLREEVAPPPGFTLIGTTIGLVKKPNGLIIPITLSLYQKD
jgi:hypothetical protein